MSLSAWMGVVAARVIEAIVIPVLKSISEVAVGLAGVDWGVLFDALLMYTGLRYEALHRAGRI